MGGAQSTTIARLPAEACRVEAPYRCSMRITSRIPERLTCYAPFRPSSRWSLDVRTRLAEKACKRAPIPSDTRAMLGGPMEVLLLIIGLLAGAAAAALALWPRLIRARSDLQHERALSQERLATVNDAQERLSASFKALSSEALQSQMAQLSELSARSCARCRPRPRATSTSASRPSSS